MKPIIFVTILVMLVVQQSNESKDSVPASVVRLMKKFSKICRVKSNITEADLHKIRLTVVPDNRSGLTYLECMLEKFGVIAFGEFKKNTILKALGPVIPDTAEQRKKWKRIVEECDKEIRQMEVKEYGDLAANIVKCLMKYELDCPVQLPLEHLR